MFHRYEESEINRREIDMLIASRKRPDAHGYGHVLCSPKHTETVRASLADISDLKIVQSLLIHPRYTWIGEQDPKGGQIFSRDLGDTIPLDATSSPEAIAKKLLITHDRRTLPPYSQPSSWINSIHLPSISQTTSPASLHSIRQLQGLFSKARLDSANAQSSPSLCLGKGLEFALSDLKDLATICRSLNALVAIEPDMMKRIEDLSKSSRKTTVIINQDAYHAKNPRNSIEKLLNSIEIQWAQNPFISASDKTVCPPELHLRSLLHAAHAYNQNVDQGKIDQELRLTQEKIKPLRERLALRQEYPEPYIHIGKLFFPAQQLDEVCTQLRGMGLAAASFRINTFLKRELNLNEKVRQSQVQSKYHFRRSVSNSEKPSPHLPLVKFGKDFHLDRGNSLVGSFAQHDNKCIYIQAKGIMMEYPEDFLEKSGLSLNDFHELQSIFRIRIARDQNGKYEARTLGGDQIKKTPNGYSSRMLPKESEFQGKLLGEYTAVPLGVSTDCRHACP